MCWSLFEKEIEYTKILSQKDGLNESDKLDNLVVGDMVGGFDGMVHAEIFNDDNSAKTNFLIAYTDGSTTVKEVCNDSSKYRKYIKKCINKFFI